MLDWLVDLEDARKPLAFLAECLDIDGIDYLEYDNCAGVLGASAIIDGLLNGAQADFPESVQEWIASNKSLKVAKLVPNAIASINAVISGNSELNELWSENGELYPKWKADIAALRDRLAMHHS
jgi:Domain of unknown function (DUF4259)